MLVQDWCCALEILPSFNMLSHTLRKTWNFCSRVSSIPWDVDLMTLRRFNLSMMIRQKHNHWWNLRRWRLYRWWRIVRSIYEQTTWNLSEIHLHRQHRILHTKHLVCSWWLLSANHHQKWSCRCQKPRQSCYREDEQQTHQFRGQSEQKCYPIASWCLLELPGTFASRSYAWEWKEWVWFGGVGFPPPDEHIIGHWGGNARKLCHLVDCHIWSANISKWASTTKSITSSVAEQSNCSQNQSTARSAGAMVSNRKSCRSWRFWGEKRSWVIAVLFMLL